MFVEFIANDGSEMDVSYTDNQKVGSLLLHGTGLTHSSSMLLDSHGRTHTHAVLPLAILICPCHSVSLPPRNKQRTPQARFFERFLRKILRKASAPAVVMMQVCVGAGDLLGCCARVTGWGAVTRCEPESTPHSSPARSSMHRQPLNPALCLY